MSRDTTLIAYQDWQDKNSKRQYPFSDSALLTNGITVIPKEAVLDAALYPIGNQGDLFLSSIEPSGDTVTLVVSDSSGAVCSATVTRPIEDSIISFSDSNGGCAGILVVDVDKFNDIISPLVDVAFFDSYQTEFCASVITPMPEVPVQSLQGKTGNVYLVGTDGVVIGDNLSINVIGDAFYIRNSALDKSGVYNPPKYAKTITVMNDGIVGNMVEPDASGNLSIIPGMYKEDNILRIEPVEHGLKIYLAGAKNG